MLVACQCFGDLVLQRSMLVCQRILVFFTGIRFAANPTANETSSNIQQVFFGGENFWVREFVRRKYPGKLAGYTISSASAS